MSSLGSYARAVERGWSTLLGRAVILSPRDWRLVRDWYSRRVPLQIVTEAIEAAGERPRATPPRGLAYVAPAVEEAWDVVREGRLSQDDATQAPSSSLTRERWLRRADTEPAESELGRLLRSLLERWERGETADALDRELDHRLADVVPRARVAAARRDVDRELDGFRRRMAAPAFAETSRRALLDRLRRELGLPRH